MLRLVLLDELGVILSLVLMVAVVGYFNHDFLRTDNLLNVARSSTSVGILALGMVFALAMREVDLSVGGVYAFIAVFTAILLRHGWNPWLTVLVALALSALCGLATGLFIHFTRVPSFIATLGGTSVYGGLALVISNGRQVGMDRNSPNVTSIHDVLGSKILGVHADIWVLVILVIVMAFVFTRTRFGGQVRAIGSNPEAAEFSGIRRDRVRIQVLMLTAMSAGVSGVLTTAFFQAGDPTIGHGYELAAIAACIIGGTPLAGGTGSVPGAALGSLILTVVASALAFFGVPINWTLFATGVVILIAVAVDAFLRRFRGAPPV